MSIRSIEWDYINDRLDIPFDKMLNNLMKNFKPLRKGIRYQMRKAARRRRYWARMELRERSPKPNRKRRM